MTHSKTFAVMVSSTFTLFACAGTELGVPSNHPGHPDAHGGRLLETTTLGATDLGRTQEGNDHVENQAAHQHGIEPAQGAARTDSGPTGVTYTCPMHPEVVSKEPGKCPQCGMKLEPKKDAK